MAALSTSFRSLGLASRLPILKASRVARTCQPQVRCFAAPSTVNDVPLFEKQYVKKIPNLGRTGLLALKCGMVPAWDEWGTRFALTVLHVDDCEVVQVKSEENDGYTALQVGIGSRKEKHTTKPMQKHFETKGVPYKRALCEFRVRPEAVLQPGTKLDVRHFLPGQYVDIAGVTIGKGFQGAMKRWGFKGQGASHGHSRSHRSLGSTGSSQGPGRVFKGKKMHGRMGGKRRTVQSQQVYRVDPERGLIYVKGHVPGKTGNYVEVKDAVKKMIPSELVPLIPFPTFTGDDDVERPLIAQAPKNDPNFPSN